MLSRASLPVSIVLCLAQALSPALGVAQDMTTSGSSGTNTPNTSTRKAGGPLGDYVPCLFDPDEQYIMRAKEQPKQPSQPLGLLGAQQLLDATKIK